MVKLLSWLAIALLALFSVVFAVSNRDVVTLTLWPFPFALTAQLYLVVLLTVLSGLLAGLLIGWIASWGVRRAARERARRIEALERELAAATAERPPATTGHPLIPHV